MARLSTKWKRESQENKYDEDKINNENLPKEINIGLQGRILKVLTLISIEENSGNRWSVGNEGSETGLWNRFLTDDSRPWELPLIQRQLSMTWGYLPVNPVFWKREGDSIFMLEVQGKILSNGATADKFMIEKRIPWDSRMKEKRTVFKSLLCPVSQPEGRRGNGTSKCTRKWMPLWTFERRLE